MTVEPRPILTDGPSVPARGCSALPTGGTVPQGRHTIGATDNAQRRKVALRASPRAPRSVGSAPLGLTPHSPTADGNGRAQFRRPRSPPARGPTSLDVAGPMGLWVPPQPGQRPWTASSVHHPGRPSRVAPPSDYVVLDDAQIQVPPGVRRTAAMACEAVHIPSPLPTPTCRSAISATSDARRAGCGRQVTTSRAVRKRAGATAGAARRPRTGSKRSVPITAWNVMTWEAMEPDISVREQIACRTPCFTANSSQPASAPLLKGGAQAAAAVTG